MRSPTTLFAFDPSDSVDRRQEKLAAFIVASMCCIAGIAWTLMYLVVFGWGLTAALPLTFVVFVGGSLIAAHRLRDHMIAVYAEIACIIGVTTAIQWSVGGAFESGLVIIWAILGPLTALMFLPLPQTLVSFGVFVAALVITFSLDDRLSSPGATVPHGTQITFAALNVGVLSAVVFAFAGYFVRATLSERERANSLLLNVLPAEIVPRLRAGNGTIAEHIPSASVLFADLVGSTPLFAELDPKEAVEWLNEVFSGFDAILEGHGLEKIRTVGDNYMVVAGAPVPREDHAHAIALLALDLIETASRMPLHAGRMPAFRIGINSGPLVAGVIGTTKFHYDVWGDTVNVASRMESQGVPGRIQITAATKELLGDAFEVTSRGHIDVKGRGTMETWFLDAPASR